MSTDFFNSTLIKNYSVPYTSNLTQVLSVLEKPVVPSWIIFCYFAFIAIGMYLNLEMVFRLFKLKPKDVFLSILQLTIVDLISICVVVTEIWTLNNGTWVFSTILCPFYLGSEVFYNTFISYFVICTNFHVISNMNLHLFQIQKDSKNPLTTYDKDNDDESEHLVSRPENRNVVIDYRRKITNISMFFPSLLVWFICISLSIPQYILSNAIIICSDCTFCTILDTRYRQMLQNLSTIFQVIIPLPLLLLTLIVLIWKLVRNKPSESIFAKKTKNIQMLLIFGLSLTILYIVTSVPRQLFHVIHIIKQEFSEKNAEYFKMLPFENITCSYLTNVISAMLHYSSNTFRPILYITIFPELRKAMSISQIFFYFSSRR